MTAETPKPEAEGLGRELRQMVDDARRDPSTWTQESMLAAVASDEHASLSAAYQAHVSAARAAESRGLERALASGIEGLSSEEREWLAQNPAERDDLARRLLAASTALDIQLHERVTPPGVDDAEADTEWLWERANAFSERVRALVERSTPDGLRARDALARLWRGVISRTVAARPAAGAAVREKAKKAEELLAAGHVPPFLDVELIRYAPALDRSDLAEVLASILWPEVREAWRFENAAELAAFYLLAREKKWSAGAHAKLRFAIEERVRALPDAQRARDFFAGTPADATADGELAGVYYRDELAARYFEALGLEGSPLRKKAADLAATVRAKAADRWQEWNAQRATPGVLPASPAERWEDRLTFPKLLARALWDGEVRDLLAREKHPAMAEGVYRPIRDALWIPGRKVGGTELEPVVVDENGQVLARFNLVRGPEVPEAALRFKVTGPDAEANLKATESVSGQLLLRFIVVTVYQQYATPGFHEPNVIEIVGGFRKLAQILGLKGRKAEDELRRSLKFLHLAEPDSELVDFRGFILFHEYPAAPGKQAVLRITVGDPFTPGYAARLTGNSLAAREARRMIPMTLRRPPLVSPRKFHKAQLALQEEVLAELRAHAADMVKKGYAIIPELRWRDMAARVRLPRAMLPRVLEAWCVAADDKDPKKHADRFLVRFDGDGYTLTDSWPNELQTIREAGQDILDGAKWQARSSKAKKRWRGKERRVS